MKKERNVLPVAVLKRPPFPGGSLDDVNYALRFFENLSDARREFESQNDPVWWVWPGKTVDDVIRLARLTNSPRVKERQDFVPEEVWVLSVWGVIRRFAPKTTYITPRA